MCFLHITAALQFGTHLNSLNRIDLQKSNCCLSYRTSACQDCPNIFEVVFPNVSSGMKQTDNFTRQSIERNKVGAFVAIAVRTGHSQIVGRVIHNVLLCLDMFEMESEKRGCSLRQATVFTAMPCPCPYKLAECSIHSS
jgi:hypothetical protein